MSCTFIHNHNGIFIDGNGHPPTHHATLHRRGNQAAPDSRFGGD